MKVVDVGNILDANVFQQHDQQNTRQFTGVRTYIPMPAPTGTAATTNPTNKMMKKKGPDFEARYGRVAGRQLYNRVSFFK